MHSSVSDAISHASTNCSASCPSSFNFCTSEVDFISCNESNKYSIHASTCCSCNLTNTTESCFLNNHPEGGFALYIFLWAMVTLLTRLYIRTGARIEEDEVEHVQKIIKYKRFYAHFGVEVNVDDYERNVYDRIDLQFLRLHRILFIGQLTWIANPLSAVEKNFVTHNFSSFRTIFTDTSSYIAKCMLAKNNKNISHHSDVQTYFWIFATLCFFIFHIVFDMIVTCRRVGCKNFGKSSLDNHANKEGEILMLNGSTVNDRSDSTFQIPLLQKSNYRQQLCSSLIGRRLRNILRRMLKITILTYFVLFPFTTSTFVQDFACLNVKGKRLNAIDKQSECGTAIPMFSFVVLWLIFPFIVYGCLYYAIKSSKEIIYNERFLHDWGFLVIGYRRNFLLWPMLDFLQLGLFCIFYWMQLEGNLNFFTRSILNLCVVYFKLTLIELLQPFESKIVSHTARHSNKLLLIMFLSVLIRIVPVPGRHMCEEDMRRGIAFWVICISMISFILLLVLSFIDYVTSGMLFERCRKKFRKYVRGKDDENNETIDDDVSEFLQLQEEYLIPENDLKILIDSDSAPIYLGAGGFGSVYKAIWSQDQSYPVAAKELIATKMESDTEQKEFVQEVKSLIAANHRNIINFYGICEQIGKC
jgi:hypothetical protein